MSASTVYPPLIKRQSARVVASLLALALLPAAAAYHAVTGEGPGPAGDALGFDVSAHLVVSAVPSGALLEWVEPGVAGLEGFQVWRSDGGWTMVGEARGLTRFIDRAPPAGATYKVTFFTGPTLLHGYVDDVALLPALAGWREDLNAAYEPGVTASGPTGSPAPMANAGSGEEGTRSAALAFLVLAALFILVAVVLPMRGRRLEPAAARSRSRHLGPRKP